MKSIWKNEMNLITEQIVQTSEIAAMSVPHFQVSIFLPKSNFSRLKVFEQRIFSDPRVDHFVLTDEDMDVVSKMLEAKGHYWFLVQGENPLSI